MKPRVFVGSSAEALPLAEAVQPYSITVRIVRYGRRVYLWLASQRWRIY